MDRINLKKKTLGEGGFGKVWLGTFVIDPESGKKIESAIKQIPVSKFDMDEFDLHAKLSKHPECHEHVVCVYDVIKDSKVYFIAMEYIKGKNLLDYLNSLGAKKIDNGKLRKWLIEALEGLEYIHKNKIAHGDIKLENIMLDKKEKLKFLDFGFGCNVKTCRTTRAFHATPYLVPPERFFDKAPSKTLKEMKRADAWALGSTFLEMLLPDRLEEMGLTGKLLHEKVEAAHKKLPVNFRFDATDLIPQKHLKGVDRDVLRVINGLLEYDPNKRLTPTQALNIL